MLAAPDVQAVLPPFGITVLGRLVQRSHAFGGGSGRQHIPQRAPHQRLGARADQVRAGGPVVVDASLCVHLEQQVGHGIERGFQLIARAAQLARHLAGQRHGPLSRVHLLPHEPSRQQAEGGAQQGNQMVCGSSEALLE